MKKIVVLVAIVLGMVSGYGMSVMAVSTEDRQISREEYFMAEQAYVDEVRQILLEKGCKNAGITLTYITDMEGQREYALTLHHRKIRQMDAEEWTLLQARIVEAGDIFFTDSKIKMVKILSDI